MNFSTYGPDRTFRTIRHGLDDVFRATAIVRGLHDVPRHFRMDDHTHAGMLLTNRFNLLRTEPGVNGAMALPQDHLRAADLIGIEAATDLVGIPDDHLV